MRVLIIGGTRFVGPYVARSLAEQGHQVTVYHRGDHEAKLPPSVTHFRDPRAAMPVLAFPDSLLNPAPDVVIHMMAMGEADGRAAVVAFGARVSRIVWLSSGDVYRAYGRFMGIEPGEPEPGLLTEDSSLRRVLYPYRKPAQQHDDLHYFYEKILVEKVALENPDVRSVVLRLPKVYGPESNQDLATMYGYRKLPSWRWTHGYVENVAAAIVLAAMHADAPRRIYNVGESYTPTIQERLSALPPSNIPDLDPPRGVMQDIAYDTARIRRELGYTEIVSYDEGIRRTLAAN